MTPAARITINTIAHTGKPPEGFSTAFPFVGIVCLDVETGSEWGAAVDSVEEFTDEDTSGAEVVSVISVDTVVVLSADGFVGLLTGGSVG